MQGAIGFIEKYKKPIKFEILKNPSLEVGKNGFEDFLKEKLQF